MFHVVHDAEHHCFWVDLVKEYQAKVLYEQHGSVLHITSTVVPEPLRGKGYGKIMMEALLAEIESLNLKVVPVCPYVVHYFERNKQWAHLLA
ncbi:GNAT family N-acetyltransferase [Vibrio sp. CAU 1672]|uniref:GNAT family N-acetyltransferase n=1 Tax=Vibrio sp. CAU 1672 TaxID=3032594 RepID=UPI0023D9AA24|nr:GNAT family N-acetyltransferase [Vibrio sp. CAU 1672]MDF2152659.1 GNAT family N-acetyltransferase [Vibrio sp. CAU 1672]